MGLFAYVHWYWNGPDDDPYGFDKGAFIPYTNYLVPSLPSPFSTD